MITSIGRCVSALLALSLYLATDSVEAKSSFPVFFGWGGESISKSVDFPDTPEFQIEVRGQGTVFLDAGAKYKTFTFFFLPLWNYDIQWVGYIGLSEKYLNYTRNELQEFASYANIELPQSPSPSFWHKYGGKLILLLPFIFIIMTMLRSNKTNDEANDKPNES